MITRYNKRFQRADTETLAPHSGSAAEIWALANCMSPLGVIPSADSMILRLTTVHENGGLGTQPSPPWGRG
jgi:hypothetical protein